jgi:protein-tyrosine phosphatase
VSVATEIHWIRDIHPLRLAIMARPRGGDWLPDEVLSLKIEGVGVVVSLLHQYEILELDLAGEESECVAQGIEYRSFPIQDRGIPESIGAYTDLVDDMAGRLRSGAAIAVHCRAGIGRSGLTVGGIVLRLGVPAEKVFPMISRARGLKVPDTPSQVEWFSAFARTRI